MSGMLWLGWRSLKLSPQVVLEDEAAQERLQKEIAGADAVIACIANRQPGRLHPELKAKWGKPGAKMIGKAMQAQGVKRLVLLNSMGVYEDFIPSGTIWKVLTPTILGWTCFVSSIPSFVTCF